MIQQLLPQKLFRQQRISVPEMALLPLNWQPAAQLFPNLALRSHAEIPT
jgi:hypothetical protein